MGRDSNTVYHCLPNYCSVPSVYYIYPHHFVTRKEYTNTTDKSFIKTTVRFLKNHRQKKQRHQQIMSKNQTVAKHEHSLSKWNVKCFFKNCVYMFTQVTDKNI